MNHYVQMGLAVFVLVSAALGESGCARNIEGDILAGAPPAPKGYESDDAVMAAVMGGQVKLVERNPPLPEGVTEVDDIEYARYGDRAIKLDLYLPKQSSKPVPGLIFIHGGGWKSGSKTDYRVYTVYFAERGYAAASITYRFSPESVFPAAVQDTKASVRWMRANAAKYNIDPNRIAVIGGSAGGHLSMMVGYSEGVPELEGDGGNSGVSSRVQTVVDFYGPPSLTIPFAQNAPEVTGFIGKSYAEARELYEKASPISYLKKGAPPTLIFHGTLDTTVPVDQSDMLAQKLKELGVPCVYDRIEGWPHTMDIAEGINLRTRYIMERFLDRYLKNAR